MKLYVLFFIMVIFPVAHPTTMSDLSSKAFSHIKWIAKTFQTGNPKMLYSEAMEKTIGGFKEIHASG